MAQVLLLPAVPEHRSLPRKPLTQLENHQDGAAFPGACHPTANARLHQWGIHRDSERGRDRNPSAPAWVSPAAMRKNVQGVIGMPDIIPFWNFSRT
ncbi:MAG: hypothetical protein ACREFU_18330 [Acetobacteraceae bacterium]